MHSNSQTTDPSSKRKDSEQPGRFRGILLMIAAVAVQSCSEAVAKLMTASLPPVQVTWMRYVVFAAIMLGVALIAGPARALRSRLPGLQILRGAAAVGAAMFFITSLSMLPMAEVTAISFVSPLLVTVLAIPLLGEIIGLRRWTAIAIGLVGVAMVLRPGTPDFSIYMVFPLAAATSWAFALVVTRLMSVSDSPLVSMTYAGLVGFALTSVLVPFVWVKPDIFSLGLGLATGLFGTAAQYLTIQALYHERASVLAPIFYTSLVWSILFGYLLFGNLPDAWTYAGAATIILSGLYTTIGRQRQ